MIKILVLGGSGMLGLDMCQILTQAGYEVISTNRESCNIADWDHVRQKLIYYHPKIVINLAALTDVDYCENHADDAYRIHYLGTKNLALICAEIDAIMVYISSGCVFGGSKKTSYTELDACLPVSHYARSKYAGEQAIQQALRKYYIVRSGWLFSGNKLDKKFLTQILNLSRTREQITVVDDKFGSPTYTVDLAYAVRKLLETECYGLYHVAGDGEPCSRFQYAARVLEYAHITKCQLIPISSSNFEFAAHRPAMEALRNYNLELMGWQWMRPWTDALKECIELRILNQLDNSSSHDFVVTVGDTGSSGHQITSVGKANP